MPFVLFVPLALYLAMAGRAGQSLTHISAWIVLVLIAYSLVYQYRIWDDLASVVHDREKHPDRVMCQAESLLPYYGLGTTIWAANFWLLSWHSGGWSKSLVFLVLSGLILIWYRCRPKASRNKLISAQIVLVKYPVIVWLLSTPAHNQREFQLLIVSMFAVYLVFAVHEILHDTDCQQATGANNALALQVTALCIVWIAMALLTPTQIDSLRIVQWITVLTALTVAVVLFLKYMKRRASTHRGYALFVVGGIVAFNLVISGLPWPS